MAAPNDAKYFDRRTVQRYIERGTLTEKDYEKYLKDLPDLADKADTINLEQPSALGAPTR